MLRTSSPNGYCLTSLNVIPRPLKVEWYSPPKTWSERRRGYISILRTFLANSFLCIVPSLNMPKWGICALYNACHPGGRNFSLTLPFGPWPKIRLGNLHFVDDFVDDVHRADVLRFGLVADSDPMAQHVVDDRPDVLGHHIAHSFDEGITFGGTGQVDAPPWGGPKGDQGLELFQFVFFRITGGKDQVEDVFLDLFVHIDLPDRALCTEDLLKGDHRFDFLVLSHQVLPDDKLFFVDLGVVDHRLEHKTIHLCLGKGIGALLVHGVLGGHHQKGRL